MADPIIKIGSTGSAVKKAQQALIDRFYLWDGTADGVFGPVTRKNVIRYQLDRSVGEWNALSYPLKIDGIVGPATWFRLTPAVIKKKSKGNGVRLLQEILKNWGWPAYDPGPVDGAFGALTEAAVKAVQTDYSLKVDGIVGTKTWAAVGS